MINILFQAAGIALNLKKETTSALRRLGIDSLRDLLFYKPASCKIKNIAPNLSQLKDGDIIQATVKIQDVALSHSSRGPTRIMVSNDTGSVLLVFFNKIPPFLLQKLRVGSTHIISGKVQYFDYYHQIVHPEFILKKDLESPLEPVYPLTYALTNKQLYYYITSGLGMLERSITAHAQQESNTRDKIEFYNTLLHNLKQLHFWRVQGVKEHSLDLHFEQSRLALAKMELLANQLSLLQIRNHKHEKLGRSFEIAKDLQQQALSNLGFTLTPSQEKAIQEIETDQTSSVQMMRLLQGDVGSGKTLVALMTILNVIASGAQATFMVPTDLLAGQHYQLFSRALEGSLVTVALLTGKTSQKERRKIYAGLENGEIQILIGTHALFQEKVQFKDLGYAVIDEQHKFGVEQRLNLVDKASCPDLLVMTATPIPRSLTLTMFGEMSVSKLTAKPQGRLSIITTVSPTVKADELINALGRKMMNGEKIYWVCPLVDQNDDAQDELSDDASDSSKKQYLMDSYTRFATIQQTYPGQVAIVHGKMSSEEKDNAMQLFKEGGVKILVATTVIEVGIDVPDATLIVIENAERFGLAQLHQLRGRVGRGSLQSYCVLLYDSKRTSAKGHRRLEIMRSSDDGFYIAEQDLMLRGSGEILGIKQSGEPEFFFANIATDLKLLEEAHTLAQNANYDQHFIALQIKTFSKKGEEVIGSG